MTSKCEIAGKLSDTPEYVVNSVRVGGGLTQKWTARVGFRINKFIQLKALQEERREKNHKIAGKAEAREECGARGRRNNPTLESVKGRLKNRLGDEANKSQVRGETRYRCGCPGQAQRGFGALWRWKDQLTIC